MRETAWAEDEIKGAVASSLPLQSVTSMSYTGGTPPSRTPQVPVAEFGLSTALWEGDGILASRARSGLLRPPPQSPAKDGPHCATPFPMTQRGSK